MNLNIAQIRELALFAGLSCSSPEESKVDPDTELSIDVGPVDYEEPVPQYYGLRACFAEYPEEGYITLGTNQ